MARQVWFESNPDQPQKERMRLRDFVDAFRALRKTGLRPGLSTGWPSLDAFYTVRPREMTVITGIPSHGKSTWLDHLMVHLATGPEQWHFAIFSPETWPLERHTETLAQQLKFKPIEFMGDPEFHDAENWIDLAFEFICPDEGDYTVDRVIALAEIAMRQDPGIRGLVIDPWNELDHSRQPHMTETEYISRALSRLRRFARRHEVHIFLVAHPAKLQRVKVLKQSNSGNSEAEIYPVPTPYDISGSAHFYNKADCCVCVWRDVLDTASKTHVYVQKVRFREVGKPGVATLLYDPYGACYVDPQ